jgi:hypothetical protein
MLVLSAVYGALLPIVNRYQLIFIYGQITVDALCISLIVYVTGGYSSVFSFLYIVVVIYSSVFVFKRGSLLVAAFCSAQFALLLLLELKRFPLTHWIRRHRVQFRDNRHSGVPEVRDLDRRMFFGCISKWLPF